MRSTHLALVSWSFGLLILSGCNSLELPGDDPSAKAVAAAKLGINGADQNIPILDYALENEPEIVQLQSIQALGRIGTDKAVAVLEKFSNHDTRLVRIAVAQALQDVLPQAHESATKVLVKMGERVRPKSPAEDPRADERTAIVTSLAVVKHPASVDYLIERLRTDHVQNILEATTRTLGRVKDPRAIDALIESYGRDNERIRAIAIEALGLIGDPRGAETVTRALQDLDAVTRGKAARSLFQIQGKAAIPVLRAHLAAESADMPAIVTAHVLALLGEQDAVPFLEDRILNAASELARAEAGKALAEVGRIESFLIVDKAFHQDRDGLVKREAGLAAIALLEKYPELKAKGLQAPPVKAAEPKAASGNH